MKHFKRERHGNAYLFKLARTGQIIAGVSEKGHTLTFPGYTDGLTDDELLELIKQTSITSNVVTEMSNLPKPEYKSSDWDIVLLHRLLPNKIEGNQYAEVELTQSHMWRGKRGDIVLWLWQDLTPLSEIIGAR